MSQHFDFLRLYQSMLPAAWGLDGIESFAVVLVFSVVSLTVLPWLIALSRGQQVVARMTLRDSLIGTLCIMSILGAWISLLFFGRALYRSLAYSD